jgi:hypothetical protein
MLACLPEKQTTDELDPEGNSGKSRELKIKCRNTSGFILCKLKQQQTL